ncbi:hypothetical protein IFR05_013663 [Cadophora sp. M221]|nr:hypothetical protein IFR05_013663 [Cadophora sp. M221]
MKCSQKEDKATKLVKRLQQQNDEAWKKLVDSRVLKPFETEEFICNIKSAYQHADEEAQAKKAVESANSAATSAQNWTKQRLAAARSQLAAAIKRKRHLADHFDQERVPKRQKENSKNDPPTHPRKGTHLATMPSAKDSSFSTRRSSQAAMQEGQLKRKSQSATKGGRPVKRSRYSHQTANTAEPQPFSVQLDRPEPKNGVTQVPKPRKTRAKVYTKERESRRIANLPPQFGMLSKRGAPAPPYVPPSQQLSNPRKLNLSNSPNHASFKNLRAVRGSKSQGRVTKSRREETNRSLRSKKRIGG